MDVMRNIQKDEIVSNREVAVGDTELDADVQD
jgi:hypothetical protein